MLRVKPAVLELLHPLSQNSPPRDAHGGHRAAPLAGTALGIFFPFSWGFFSFLLGWFFLLLGIVLLPLVQLYLPSPAPADGDIDSPIRQGGDRSPHAGFYSLYLLQIALKQLQGPQRSPLCSCSLFFAFKKQIWVIWWMCCYRGCARWKGSCG